MKQLYRAGTGLVALMLATAPAAAAVVISPDGKAATITTNEAASLHILTTGNKGDPGTDLNGLNGSLLFELVGGFNTSQLIFQYTLKNISTFNNVGSSIAVFGFDVAPDATLDVLTGPFEEGSKGNFSGLGKREFCLFEGSNCNGGANDGVYVNNAANALDPKKMLSATGTFRLNYGNPAPTQITFSNFATRWQRVGAIQKQSASGTGIVSMVPEPEQWAMLILGFAAVGGMMRMRGRAPLATA